MDNTNEQNANEETFICYYSSSVAQSKGLNLFPVLNYYLSTLSCKISNLSISLWGKHSCSHYIFLYKHLSILFELCSSTHYTSFEEWMLEHWYILILKLLNATQQQITFKPLFCWLIIHRPCAEASRINSQATRKIKEASKWDAWV